jgi:WD40 repeat protein
LYIEGLIFGTDLIFSCGSNHAVEIFDVGKEAVVRTISEAHSKSVHSIRLNDTSKFSNLDPVFYEMFLTSSTDGNIKLWDLRAQK